MSELVCEPCAEEGSQIEAFGFCLDCCDHLCEDCYLYHRKPKQTRHHVLLDTEQMLQQKDSLPTKDAIKESCPQHSEETVKYFCQTHDIPGCTVCITTDHRLCEDVVHVPQVSKGIADSEEYKELEVDIDETAKRLEAVIPTATENIARSEECNTNVQKAICEFMDDIVATISKLKNSAQEEAEQCKEADIQRMNAIITKSNDELKKMQIMKSSMQNLERLGRENKLFIAVKSNRNDLKELHEDLAEWERDHSVRIYRFEANPDLRDSLNNTGCLGNLTDTVEHAVTCIETSSTEDTGSVESVSTGDQVTLKPVFIRDVNIHFKTDKELVCDVVGLAILSNDKAVLADEKNSKIKLIDLKKGTMVAELSTANKPTHLAKVNDTELAVNLNEYGIVLLKVEKGIEVERLLKCGDYPCDGFSCCTDDFYICKGNETIKKIDKYGTEVTEFTSQSVPTDGKSGISKQNYFFHSVVYGQAGHKQLYAVVLDKTYTRVQVQKYREYYGDYINDTEIREASGPKYLAYGTSKEGVKDKISVNGEPSFITMGDDGKLVFVIAGDVIYVVRAGEKHARVLLGREDGVFNVSCVAYCSNTGRLAVTMRDNNFMKAFQLQRMV